MDPEKSTTARLGQRGDDHTARWGGWDGERVGKRRRHRLTTLGRRFAAPPLHLRRSTNPATPATKPSRFVSFASRAINSCDFALGHDEDCSPPRIQRSTRRRSQSTLLSISCATIPTTNCFNVPNLLFYNVTSDRCCNDELNRVCNSEHTVPPSVTWITMKALHTNTDDRSDDDAFSDVSHSSETHDAQGLIYTKYVLIACLIVPTI